MTKKREAWRLPKIQKHNKVDEYGMIQRRDGEPRIHKLTLWSNDRTLCTDSVVTCCDCGLTHNMTYNVLKTPDGDWHLLIRAYRIPGTGKDFNTKNA